MLFEIHAERHYIYYTVDLVVGSICMFRIGLRLIYFEWFCLYLFVYLFYFSCIDALFRLMFVRVRAFKNVMHTLSGSVSTSDMHATCDVYLTFDIYMT